MVFVVTEKGITMSNITREEAIKTLKELWRETNDQWYEETYAMAIEALEQEPVKTLKKIPEACKNCSNHPSNGGSGVCFCTLGSIIITY